MTEQRKLLVLQAHNLGDAVISTALIETIAHGLPTAQIDVLTRPEIRSIFINNPAISHVYTGRFPMGSVHDFGLMELLSLSGLILRLRRQRYTDVVNLAGDFREEFLASLISRRDNWSPAWSSDHPCSKVIRRSLVPLANQRVNIPAQKPSIYDAASIIGNAIGGAEGQKSALYNSFQEKVIWDPLENGVGIHPMASQPWRKWEIEKWQSLAKHLVAREMDVYVFGAPADAEELRLAFGDFDTRRVTIVTGSLAECFTTMARMRVLLCHDSFASHVAYAMGVPTILLNGANDAAAWAPPGAIVLAAGPGLTCYPCYNRPTCFGSPAEFACVREISFDTVLDTTLSMLKLAPRNRFPASSIPRNH